MIHIELKNRQHSYMDAFWQIKSISVRENLLEFFLQFRCL
ncbi:MAG: hypothetical protein ACLTR4_01560 [Gallintestinimicrobium sp.]